MYIYKTTNLINNKYYIGKDSRDKNSPKALEYLGSGLILNYAIKKYGRENFKKEIIDECDTQYELNHLEKFWISFYHSTNKRIGYNLAPGGQGGNLGDESNKKIGIWSRNFWANKTKEEKRLIAKLRWKNMPIEIKSKQINGWKNADAGKRTTKANKTRYSKLENKLKTSEFFKNLKRTKEWGEKISKSKSGKVFEKIQCLYCEKMISVSMIKNHSNKKHKLEC